MGLKYEKVEIQMKPVNQATVRLPKPTCIIGLLVYHKESDTLSFTLDQEGGTCISNHRPAIQKSQRAT